MARQDFVDTLVAEQAALDAFLDSLTLQQRTQPNLCGTWSARDIVVHLSLWARYMTTTIRAWLRHRPASDFEMWGVRKSPDLADDALNQWFIDHAKGQTFDEARGILREVHTQLIGTVELLSDEELTTPGLAIPRLGDTHERALTQAIMSMSYGHVQHHIADIKSSLHWHQT